MLICFHLFFDKDNFFKNSANYLVITLFIMSIITIIIFLCYNNKKIETYIYNKKEEKKQNNQDINKIIIKTEIKRTDAQSNEGSNKGKKVKSNKRRLINSPISNLNFQNNKFNKSKESKKIKRKNKKKSNI